MGHRDKNLFGVLFGHCSFSCVKMYPSCAHIWCTCHSFSKAPNRNDGRIVRSNHFIFFGFSDFVAVVVVVFCFVYLIRARTIHFFWIQNRTHISVDFEVIVSIECTNIESNGYSVAYQWNGGLLQVDLIRWVRNYSDASRFGTEKFLISSSSWIRKAEWRERHTTNKMMLFLLMMMVIIIQCLYSAECNSVCMFFIFAMVVFLLFVHRTTITA